MMKRILAAAAAATFTAAAAAQERDKSAQAQSGRQQGTAAVVLVPFVLVQAPDFSEGCWARLYDGQNYAGDVLTVVGPSDMPNMRTAFGTDWSGSFDSVQVGPKATVTVYDNENYTQKTATFKPDQRIADLDQTRGFFEDIRSLKIACAGGARSAQKSGGSQAAAGDTKQPQSGQKQQE
jgi:hypothetical protein